jgi:integrase
MEQERRRPKLALITEDSFASLVRLFMSPANPKWHSPQPVGYADSTKTTWARELRFAARPDCLGSLSLQEIRPALVQAYFDGLSDRPGKQAAALTVMRQLEAWAIVRDLLPRQITLGVEIGECDGGHVPWSDEQVAAAELHARSDFARVVTLGANTGQRGSDLVRMCPTDIETYKGIDGINVTQQKTGRQIWVPILEPLARAIEKWERRPGPFLRRLNGLPWPRPELSKRWAEERDRNPHLAQHSSIPLVIHGLRGHACVRLRRAGATTMQIADMIGMSVEMVEQYCRLSVQRDNAIAAVYHLDKTLQERNGSLASKSTA